MLDHSNDLFRLFLNHTNEKAVILEAITGLLTTYNVTSVLDIGAGDGTIARVVMDTVPIESYVAVEPDQAFRATLSDIGCEVLTTTFPVEIATQFDLVLMVHSLYFADDKEAFINAGRDLLTDDGHLVVIITKGDELSVRQALANEFPDPHLYASDMSHQEFLRLVEELKPVVCTELVAEVITETVEDALAVLPFIASDAYSEDKVRAFRENHTALGQFLDTHYKRDGQYVIPQEQLLVVFDKNSEVG